MMRKRPLRSVGPTRKGLALGNLKQWLIIAFVGVMLAGSVWLLAKGLIQRKVDLDGIWDPAARDRSPIIYWLVIGFWAVSIALWGTLFSFYLYWVLTGDV